jgi:hypothetical protein
VIRCGNSVKVCTAPFIDLDMGKYIDAEKLKAHIQYLIKKDNYELFDVPELLSFIDSLQQEQLDIDKIKREWYNKGYLEGRKNAHIPARELGLPKSWDFQQEQPEVDLEKEFADFLEKENAYVDDNNKISYYNGSSFDHTCDIYPIARHFFNLDINARKEENK